MKAGFVTCVQIGLDCMEGIYEAGGQIELAVTLPDDAARTKSGRVYIDDFCADRGIDLLKVGHVDDPPVARAVRERGLDWLFIIGWSQIAGADVLAAPRRGALGAHPTLLPEGRGRAAIPWAILKELPRTAVTLFKLAEGVDSGPVLLQEVLELDPREDATRLYGRVARAHRALLRSAWPLLASGDAEFTPQDESQATYWPRRTEEDGELSPDMSPGEMDRLVRATTRPYPGAFLDHDGTRYRVWSGMVPEDRPESSEEAVSEDEDGRLWIRGRSGWFLALDWRGQEPPSGTLS